MDHGAGWFWQAAPDSTQLAAVQALQLLQNALVLRVSETATLTNPVNPSIHPHQTLNATTTTTTTSSSSGSSNNSSMADAGMGVSSNNGFSKLQVQGAYLYGPVGSGKTLLMQMFLETLPAMFAPSQDSSSSSSCNSSSSSSSSSSNNNSAPSSGNSAGGSVVQISAHRMHFHEFMLWTHEQLHQLHQSLPKVVALSRSGLPIYRRALPPEDPVLVVARHAAAGLHLLCLDELHVTDVADAMLLARLFGEVLRCGCSVLVTSNRPPHDLYKGGLSRKYFEPFIKLIDDQLLQLKVAGSRDYRLLQAAERQPATSASAPSAGMWLLGPAAEQQLHQQWQQLLVQQQAAPSTSGAITEGPSQLRLPFGRSLYLAKSVLQHQQHLVAAFFSFEELCGNQGSRQSLAHSGALSANDYLALVRSCRNIFLSGLPQLSVKSRDEARRLVTLIDVIYDAHVAAPGAVRLFVSADVPPSEVFLPLLGAAARQGVNPNLGRARGSKLDVTQLLQTYSTPGGPETQHDLPASTMGSIDNLPPVASSSSKSSSSSAGRPDENEVWPSALLPEEVLMYHRATSRLAELCSVWQQAEAVEPVESRMDSRR